MSARHPTAAEPQPHAHTPPPPLGHSNPTSRALKTQRACALGCPRHTAYPNLSQKDRRNVIAMFQPAKEGDRLFVAANEAGKKSKL